MFVRAHLTGSAFKEYKQKGSVCGIALPEGLHDGSALQSPIVTPATKAAVGSHDENITEEQAINQCLKGDAKLMQRLKTVSLQLFETARELCAKRGV